MTLPTMHPGHVYEWRVEGRAPVPMGKLMHVDEAKGHLFWSDGSVTTNDVRLVDVTPAPVEKKRGFFGRVK